jgi:hypothetical protein
LIQKVTEASAATKSRNPETRYAQTAGFRLDSKFVRTSKKSFLGKLIPDEYEISAVFGGGMLRGKTSPPDPLSIMRGGEIPKRFNSLIYKNL